MNKESLEKAKDIIIQSLDNSDIIPQDKLELMLNISKVLDEEKYEENIKVLRKGERN